MATMDNVDWGTVVTQGSKVVGAVANAFVPGAGAIISGLGNTIGSGMSSKYDVDQQLASEERAKAEYDRQFAMQNAEYDRRVADERAYNDPSAQAARLKQAGINPLSALGSFNVASNTAGDPGQPSTAPNPEGVRSKNTPLSMAEQLQTASMQEDLEAKRLENEQRRLDLQLTSLGIDKSTQELLGLQLSNRIAKVNAEIVEATKGDKITLSNATVRNTLLTTDELIVRIRGLEKDNLLKDKEYDVMDSIIASNLSAVALNAMQEAGIQSEIDFRSASAQNMLERIALDRQIEERVKTQGLAGLRIEAARLKLVENEQDLEKYIAELTAELKSEGLDIDWSNLGVGAISTIAWIVLLFASKDPTKATAGSKTVSTLIRKVLKTAK